MVFIVFEFSEYDDGAQLLLGYFMQGTAQRLCLQYDSGRNTELMYTVLPDIYPALEGVYLCIPCVRWQ